MSAALAILRPHELRANDNGRGTRITPLVTPRCGSTSLINGITTLDPGAALDLHFHNCEECVMVLEGEAIVEIDAVSYRLATDDTAWIPANLPHRVLNAGE